MYAQPCLWVALAVLAVVRFEFIWLTLVGESILSYPTLFCLDVVGACGGLADMGGVNSHRARPYNHEYPRLLALRQVQPRVESGGERALLGGFGEESGWGGCE